MSKITYEPIKDEFDPDRITEDDLYALYRKLQTLYEDGRVPEKIIQIKEKR